MVLRGSVLGKPLRAAHGRLTDPAGALQALFQQVLAPFGRPHGSGPGAEGGRETQGGGWGAAVVQARTTVAPWLDLRCSERRALLPNSHSRVGREPLSGSGVSSG